MPVDRPSTQSIWRAEFLRPTETVVQFRLLAERGIPVAQKQEEDDKVRLDKWLWAARFYKTRALAKAAIESGKVHCRGERCKPGKEPHIGDEIQVRTGFDERTVVVQALSIVRRGAPEAQLLYTETPESVAQAAGLAHIGSLGVTTDGRPTKKQRRQLHDFHGFSGSD